MAFSGGTFSRTFDCTTDRDNGVKILASKFDTELDGMATGLSTTILKDGTQTCTAAIPFAQGITIADNKTITLGTNSDVTIQYDETTNDSLEIAANVEGAALGIVLKADQGDDAGDEWKLNIADGGTLTLGNDINSAGTYVTHLTITPNATVASSTTAVAGNLTIGGALTLGSGAVISEAELETIDGITPGTAAASKAMVLDASLDISGGRNLTISGELDAATLDISGNADIDGTLEADAITIGGTAIDSVLSPVAGSGSIVTTGALNSGSITSGFGAIDNGSSAITTTGVITGGTLEATTDTAAGDNAAIGYTAAEGLILTGQGTTSDITLKNDADATVFTVPTGTDDILFPDGAKAMFGAGSNLQVYHNATHSYIDNNTGNIYIRSNVDDDDGGNIVLEAKAGENGIIIADDGDVSLHFNGNPKLATTNTGVDVTGTAKSDLVVVDSTGGATPTYSHTNNGEGITLRYNDDSGARAADIVAIGNNPAGATMAMRFFVNPNSTDAAAEVMRIQNGNVGIGTASPDSLLELYKAGTSELMIGSDNAGTAQLSFYEGNSSTKEGFLKYDGANNNVVLGTSGAANALVIPRDSGNVGINTSTPASLLEVKASALNRANGIALRGSGANDVLYMYPSADNVATIEHLINGTTDTGGTLAINPQGGSVGIGTASPSSGVQLDVRGDGVLQLVNTDTVQLLASNGGSTLKNVSNNPLLFGTNNTERMRLLADGDVAIGKTSNDFGAQGFFFDVSPGQLSITCNQNTPLRLNRVNNDGTVVSIQGDGSEEGTISISGGTVSYNGGHLSRWSHLPDGEKDDTILKGTVLTNLDDMCHWVDEDGNVKAKEQLNQVQISSVEGDKNVAGVMVNWCDVDEAKYPNTIDLNMAMTGDMVIRIAQGTTVARGDLLMSAGDGTAKPQGDDIVRSKTIAKVTSTNVSHTYDDGSYCVPCVLMAC